MVELYLDANAHISMNPKAIQAYTDFCNSPAGHGHPSSPSQPGRQAANAFEVARGKIASLIGAKTPGQIIFTAGCTQACEWGLDIFFNIDSRTDWFVASSPFEHPAVRDAFSTLHDEYCPEQTIYLDNKNGIVCANEDYFDKLCCTHMQNEIGTIQPVANLQCKYLFSDMSQSLGKIPLNVTELDVDVAVFGAHKFGGPGGFGFIYLKDTNHWEGFGSGSRYFLDRPGTPDVAGAVATAVALEEAISTLEKRTQNMMEFQSTLETGLEKLGYEVVAKDSPRSPNTTFVSMPEKGLASVFKLGEKGIHTGLGSACGSMHTGPSPLMKALKREGGVNDYMRISQWGGYKESEAKRVLNILEKA